jgi:uncharacterized protein YecA (UPF0149 family)
MNQDICFRLFRTSLRLNPQTSAHNPQTVQADSESTTEAGTDNEYGQEPDIILPKPTRFVHAQPEAGRNDLCPCGSGKKYKKCCGSRDGISDQHSRMGDAAQSDATTVS